MKMYHDDIEAIADTSLEAYHANWAPRGWKLLDAPEAFASEVLGKPVKKVGELLADEIKALHSARGLEYPSGNPKKSDLEKTFRDTFAETDPVVDEVGEPAAAAASSTSGSPTPAADNTTKKD